MVKLPDTHISISQLKAIHESAHPAKMHSVAAIEIRAELEKMLSEERSGLMNDPD